MLSKFDSTAGNPKERKLYLLYISLPYYSLGS
nr:MAG TPA: hypothetical protein [Caudoviricetes sp.]